MEIIKEIKIKELRAFIDSQEYQELENIPISYQRAVSYINNPRSDMEDIAITLLYKDNLLVAYRSLFSDFLFNKNEKIKFAWISGSWVHPDYRRQGYSMKLLEYCFNAKNGNLMFSNYAPESKSLYDKSELFSEVTSLNGFRFYFRFSFSELLPPKHSFFRTTKPLLFFLDYFLNFYFDIRFYLNKQKVNKINFHETDNIDSETQAFIEKHHKQNPFRRSIKELNHAISFPWVIEKAHSDINDDKYFFSSSSKKFKTILLKFYSKEQQVSAFLFLKIKHHSLTIPYTFFEENELSKLVKIILFYVKKHRINYLTSFNETINREIMKQRNFVLFSKTQRRAVFASDKLTKHFSISDRFFDGDGDRLFT